MDPEALKRYRIILASRSPRRKELLQKVGIECTVYPGLKVNEEYPGHLKGEEIPVYLAALKSQAYPEELKEGEILLTADTIVCQDEEVLHKPANPQEARSILKKLSGRDHYVYSGVCIRSEKEVRSFTASTRVWFDSLSDVEINYYIQAFQPFDKAGAYGIQEWIGLVGVERIDGSFYNVMGLPVHMLYRELEKFIH